MALVKIRMVDKAIWWQVADHFPEVVAMRVTMWDLSKLEDLGMAWCDVRTFVSTRYTKMMETFNYKCIVGCSIP